MIDIKEAREILGVAADANKDEILKRYDILLKKHKVSSRAGEEENIKIEDINKAYNLLMGYESIQPEIPPRSNPLLAAVCKKFKWDEKKVANYIHYYKVHAVVGIIALIVLITTVRGCVTRVDPDFYLTTIGNIYIADSEVVEKDLKELFPELKAPVVDPLYITGEDMSEQNYAMQMKAMTLLAAGDMDVVIMDKDNFNKYVKQGALTKLDDLVDQLNIDKEKNKDYIVKPSEETVEDLEEGLYGVDISESEFIKRNNIKGKEIIAAIKVNPRHKDKSVEVLKILLNGK